MKIKSFLHKSTNFKSNLPLAKKQPEGIKKESSETIPKHLVLRIQVILILLPRAKGKLWK